MTKKFSILSIVVVLLLSVCLVGCGDSSISTGTKQSDISVSSKNLMDTQQTTTTTFAYEQVIDVKDYSKKIIGSWKAVEGDIVEDAYDGRIKSGHQDFKGINYILSFHSDSTVTVDFTDSTDSDLKGKYYEIKDKKVKYGRSISDIHSDELNGGHADYFTIIKMTENELELAFPSIIGIFMVGTIRFVRE